MEKEATELLRQALLGLLMGGGAYGGARLLSDIGSASKKPERPHDELEITLPSSRLPKVANDGTVTAADQLLKLLAIGGGATGGFMGASHLYDQYRQNQLKAKEKAVEDNYLQTLQQAHQKVASMSTPLIDKFLEGLLSKTGEELKKEGWDALNTTDQMTGAGGALFEGLKNNWGALKDSLNTQIEPESFSSIAGEQGKKLMHGAANTGIGSTALAAWLAATGLAGGATYAIANRLDKQKQQSKEQTTLPQEINLRVHG